MFRFIIVLILFTAQLFAEYENVATRLYIETKEGYSLDRLVFGIHKEASDYLDTLLGESELPPFPPPDGIHAGFLFLDTAQNETIMSYKDFRPYPGNVDDTVKYVLIVMKGAGDIITFKWHPLGPEIARAYIVDRITHGSLVNINMKDSTEARIENEFIEKFEIVVFYNDNPLSVEQYDNPNETVFVYPVEFTDKFTIKSMGKYKSYKIYNLFGSLAAEGMLVNEKTEIDFNAAAPGVYFVVVFDAQGRRLVQKIIKY